jgi:TPR repeat protein
LLESALKGDAESQFQLGKRSYEEARVWLRKAAVQGHELAITLLKEAMDKGASNQEHIHLGDFESLPVELWKGILSYVKYPEIISVRQANRCFYKLTSGYDKPGLIGLKYDTNPTINIEDWNINKKMALLNLDR